MRHATPPGQALARNDITRSNVVRITAIYDNGGKTLDRYTVITDKKWSPSLLAALGLSHNPEDYNGFSQWTGATDGDHLGEPIKFVDLDGRVQQHISKRIFGI